MGYGSSRPPVTEGVADAITRDIKSNEGKGATSEVPLAFQAGRPPVDPAILGKTRKQMSVFIGLALVLLALLLGIWTIA